MCYDFHIAPGTPMPSAGEVKSALAGHGSVRIHYSIPPEKYLQSLSWLEDAYMIVNNDWKKFVRIYPSVTEAMILERKEEIRKCAQAFREESGYLVNLMRNTPGIRLAERDDWSRLLWTQQRGALDHGWTYTMHGLHCRFLHRKSQRMLEVAYNSHPAFGHIDAWHFMEFLSSAKEFKHLARFFSEDHLQFRKAMNILLREGMLEEVEIRGDTFIFAT